MVRQCLDKVLIECCFLKSISYEVNILGICKICEFTHAMKIYKNNLFCLSVNYLFKTFSQKYSKKAFGLIREYDLPGKNQ